MKTFPTLYGVSSKGVTKVWSISVELCPQGAVMTVTHGQLNGKNISITPTTAAPQTIEKLKT